jgi:predicted permease
MKLQHEFRHAGAGLKKTPMFVFSLVFTLSLTLGALIAAFNLNQVILLNSLPYPDAEQLYIQDQEVVRGGRTTAGSQFYNAQLQIYNKSKAFVTSALVHSSNGILASVPSEPRLRTLYVTHEFFNLLAVPFEIGTGISPSEQMNDARAEVVISYDTWQQYYSSDTGIIGQSLQFNDEQFTVVGVIKKGFELTQPFTKTNSQIYLPAVYSSALSERFEMESTRHLRTLLKLTSDQNPIQISAQLSAVFSEHVESKGNAEQFVNGQLTARLTPLISAIKGDNGQITLIVLAGAFVLLLIALVNVINLYLSHINKRQQNLAICACLGAKPKALFKRLFVESLILTMSATFFALLIAAWLLELTYQLAFDVLPRLNELALDLVTLVFSVIIAVILAALLSFCGRFAVDYNALKKYLSASGKGGSAQVSPKVRHTLIASQIALTGLLIVVTSVVLQMSLATVNHPLGINIDDVLSVEVDASKNYTTDKQRLVLATQMKQHLLTLPQVVKVSNTFQNPFNSYGDRSYNLDKTVLTSFKYNRIDEDYLDLVQLPLLHGRNFNRDEIIDNIDEDNEQVVLVSKSMALYIFNKTNVVGERIFIAGGNRVRTIVGVVDDYFSAIRADRGEPYFYRIKAGWNINLLIKFKPDMTMSKSEIIEQLRSIEPSLRIFKYDELEQVDNDRVYKYRLTAWIAGGLSLFALILACTGIYGVISYSTQMRRFELGVRMALGAKRKRIIDMVLKDALKPILMGLGFSVLFSILLYGVANNQITELGQLDILQVSLSLVLLLFFSLLACFIPVNTIIKQDPTKALRND